MAVNYNYSTPLRYPGGKSKLSAFIEDILSLNDLENCTLYELYAGGAGASLNILFSNYCSKVVLNDLDYHIYAFWYSILNYTEEFIRLIEAVDVNLETWSRQQFIYSNHEEFSTIEVGFSTFFLNRCNRSGILYKAGPIGGRNQNGNYKIDVRFNKIDLIDRIVKIGHKRDQIEIYNLESIKFLKEIFDNSNQKKFIFLDPPYYVQGENLYFNFYKEKNHLELSSILEANKDTPWLLTYDNCNRINEIYSEFRRAYLPMSYTLQSKKKSKEVMIFSDCLYIPRRLKIGSKASNLNLIEAEIDD